MQVISQGIDEILRSLQPLKVDWQDDTARRVITALKSIHKKLAYNSNDIKEIFDNNFDDGLLICRLFLGLSKDQLESLLRDAREARGTGIKAYRSNPDGFIQDLIDTGLLESMAEVANRKPHWTDVLVERLRSGRGSAIAGQRRGRGVEDFAESIVAKVFGSTFDARCTFTGLHGKAKCDFAIPSKSVPRIVIEAKGYGATGSKMTDVLGDLQRIVDVKRPDTFLLFFTDGLTWKQRKSDLAKIVSLQNSGHITRIYNYAMADQFEADLYKLKEECGL